jgi:hypothetical protein
MFSEFSLPELLFVAALLAVGTLIVLSMRRSEPHRKFFYMFLVVYEMAWLSILDRLLALAGVPSVWRDWMWGVLFVPVVATFVLFYRHRHDPDPEDI